jgi:hypothetical protein
MTAATQDTADGADWHAFMAWPVSYIDAGRLDRCFANRLGRELCGRLRDSRRLRDRLSSIIAEHHALAARVAADACGDLDRAIALSSAERLFDIARRCGAIHWARAIAGVVRPAEVAALHHEIDEALCTLALTHRDLAGAQELAAIEEIGARSVEDGLRCIAAWTRAQPAAVGQRVRLKLAAHPALDDPPAAPFADTGPSIVRRAAA